MEQNQHIVKKGDFSMNELCQIIKNMVIPNFINIETSIKTYDRNADCRKTPV